MPLWSYFLGGNATPREAVVTTPHDPYAISADEAVDHLRMLAIEQRLGRIVGADQLIQAALVALTLDVDTPALRVLAGLTRSGSRWPRISSFRSSMNSTSHRPFPKRSQLPAGPWCAGGSS